MRRSDLLETEILHEGRIQVSVLGIYFAIYLYHLVHVMSLIHFVNRCYGIDSLCHYPYDHFTPSTSFLLD